MSRASNLVRKFGEQADIKSDLKSAAKTLQNLLNEFKKTGHAFELLGSSDELSKVDDFRDLLKSLIAKGMK